MRVFSCLAMTVVVFAASVSVGIAGPKRKAAAEQTLKKIQVRIESDETRQLLRDQMFWVRNRATNKFEENEEWYKNAVRKERREVLEAEESYEDGDYEKARERYLKALAIEYDQWHFAEAVTRIINKTPNWYEDDTVELVFEKKHHSLSTPYTILALSRMERIDEQIAEDDLIDKVRDADKAYEAENFARAYGLFKEASDLAMRTEDSVLAAVYAGEIKKKRDAIYNAGSKLLQDAEAALAAADDKGLLPAMESMQKKYSAFKGFGALAIRYRKLAASPLVEQLRLEQSARSRLDLADSALLRKDYLHAEEFYQSVIKRFPGTKAAGAAENRLADMAANPEVAKIIKEQKAELVCTGLMIRAGEWVKLGEVKKAIAEYDKIIAEYPGTPWAEKAALAREAILTEKPSPADGKTKRE